MEKHQQYMCYVIADSLAKVKQMANPIPSPALGKAIHVRHPPHAGTRSKIAPTHGSL